MLRPIPRNSPPKRLATRWRTEGQRSGGRATETEDVSQVWRKRGGSVVYTTLPHAPFPAFASWRADVRTRNRAALDLGGFCCPGWRRLPSCATWPTWRPCWPSSPGWPGLPDLAWDGATWSLCAATCGFLSGVGASAGAPAPAFAVSSGMRLRTKIRIGVVTQNPKTGLRPRPHKTLSQTRRLSAPFCLGEVCRE